MKICSVPFNNRRRGGGVNGLVMAMVTAAWFALAGVAPADDNTNAVPAKASPPKNIKASKHALSGVELYAVHCNRCHPERYPVEMNDAEWQTVMLHMRVRANLPATQARAIMKYLQEEAGE